MGPFVLLGIITGSIYALFALGIVLMYQTTGIVNVAFGALGVLAAFGFHSLAGSMPTGAAFVAVLVASLAGGALLGLVTLPARFASVMTKSVASLGIVVTVPAFVAIVWGTDIRSTPFLSRSQAFTIAGVMVTTQQVITFVAAFAVAGGMLALFRWGQTGAALRAVAADVETSQLIGLPVRQLWVLSWCAATFAAALAAMLVIPSTSLSITTMTFVVLSPLAAALAAQFRRPLVALGAALVAGVADGILAKDADWASYRGVVPLVVVLIGTMSYRSSAFPRWERV